MKSGKTYKIINTSEANLSDLQSQKALEIASIINFQTKANPYVESSLDCQYRGWKKSGPSDVTTVTVESSEEIESSSFLLVDNVKVGDDLYRVSLTITAPIAPLVKRDMEKVRTECERLLPAWIKSKIERGEP